MTEVQKHKAQRSEATQTPCDLPWRVAYPFVHKMKTKRGNGADLKTPHFNITLLAPKLNADPNLCANYRRLYAHCEQAAMRAWGSWPIVGAYIPIQDGDVPYTPKPPAPGQPIAPVDPNKYAWRRGNWIIESTNYLDQGPLVAVLQNGQVTPIPAQTINGRQYYKSGDYAVVSLHAYTFHNEKFGVNFSFEGITWIAEGEVIGASGQKSAAAMFAGVSMPAGFTAIGGPPSQPGPAPQYAPPAPAPGFAPALPAPVYAPPAPIAYGPAPAPTAPVYAPPSYPSQLQGPPSSPPAYPMAPPPAPGGYAPQATMAPAGLPPFPVPR